MEINPKDGYFSLGLNTCKVPMKLFDENRQRLAKALRENPDTPQNAVVLLQAGGEMGNQNKFLNVIYNTNETSITYHRFYQNFRRM